MTLWIKLQRLAAVLGILTLAPGVLYAGWFSDLLGAGKVAQAARDVTLAVVLKQFLDTWMPHLFVLALAGLAVWSFHGARESLAAFGAAWAAAAADGHVSRAERVGLVALYLPTLAATAALLWFGGVFAVMASGALLEILGGAR